MKTKFFKKLSFVLVVAMVLSLLVPATGAFAASAKLNSSKKYLHLGREESGENEFNFNIKNKQKGWKYAWESFDEDVVEVNAKNGVTTATGVGKTKVTVLITDEDGEEVDTLSATVTVRDNIDEVTISNKVEKLSVGQEYDYNRSYVTESGSTKKTSSITRWTVEPADKATIDEKGVFVATEAGEYTVTALSFQSKARYNAWLDDAEANAGEVLDTDETKVVVAGSMVEAKQVDLDTVNVTFDSAMEDVAKNINLYQLVGTSKVKQLVKEVKLADDKKSAEVTVYIPFTAEATYIVGYPEMDDVSFTVARKKAEDVAYIKVDTTKAVYGESTEVVVKLFNTNDVDISDGSGLASRVTMVAEDVAGTFFDGKNIMIFDENKSVKVTATYHTYDWDQTTGEEIGNLEAVGIIAGVDADTSSITGLNAWTIVKENSNGTFSPDFDDVKHLIAAEDEAYRLFVKFNSKIGNDAKTVNSKDNEDDFVFESSNDEIMIVGEHGRLYPNKQGVVTVVVKYGTGDTKNPVGAIQVTVNPKAKASNLVLGTYDLKLSNIIVDDKEVSLKLTDQTGREVPFVTGDVEVKKHYGPEIENESAFFEVGDKKVTFRGFDQAEGKYSFKVTVKEVTRYVNVEIKSTDDATVKNYVLEIGSVKTNLKVEDNKVEKNVAINLYGLAANGTKVDDVTFDGSDFKLVVDAPYVSGANWDYINDQRNTADNNTATTDDANAVTLFDDGKYTLVDATSGSSIKKAPTGSYKVTAYEYKNVGTVASPDMRWVIVSTKSFVVEDTQTLPTVSKIKTLVYTSVDSTSDASVLAVVADCFEIKLDGIELTDFEGVEKNGTDNSLYIKTVTVRKYFDIADGEGSAYIDFKVNVNQTIRKK